MTRRRDLAGCAGRPPAEDRSTSRAATSHLAGRAPSVQTPGPGRAGRPPQQKPRQGPESPVPAACPKSKSIPLRPIWPVMVSSETPGPSMMVAGRARNHHTPPRNPSGRLENVVPDQDVSGRSRIPPSAPPVVDGGNTSQGVEGGSGGGIRQAMPGDVRQRARQGRHPWRPGPPLHPTSWAALHRWRRSARACRSPAPRSGGTAERGEWAAPVWTGRAAISEIFTRPGARPDVQANHMSGLPPAIGGINHRSAVRSQRSPVERPMCQPHTPTSATLWSRHRACTRPGKTPGC